MNLPGLHLFCRCCCCWLHSTSWLKSANTIWRLAKFSCGIQTSWDTFSSVRNMKINAIIGDGRNWQHTEDTLSLFKQFCSIFSANFDRFLSQRYQKKCFICQLNLISLIFLQLMRKMTRNTADIIFSWLQNLITDVCFNLVYISLTVKWGLLL